MKGFLAQESPLETPELAVRAIQAKGMDDDDPVLRERVRAIVSVMLHRLARRGQFTSDKTAKGINLWRLPT